MFLYDIPCVDIEDFSLVIDWERVSTKRKVKVHKTWNYKTLWRKQEESSRWWFHGNDTKNTDNKNKNKQVGLHQNKNNLCTTEETTE